jgi:hypothetical protein
VCNRRRRLTVRHDTCRTPISGNTRSTAACFDDGSTTLACVNALFGFKHQQFDRKPFAASFDQSGSNICPAASSSNNPKAPSASSGRRAGPGRYALSNDRVVIQIPHRARWLIG